MLASSRLLLIALLLVPTVALAVDVPGTVHEAETGTPLAGWTVRFDGATPDQVATVGDDGAFIIDAPTATTELEVRSRTGVSFGRFAPDTGKAVIQVEPSGHVYASETATPAAGVVVELRRGAAIIGSQETDAFGLYRFTVPAPGGYSLNLRVDGQHWHFPSAKVPPQPGNAVFDPNTFMVDGPAAPAANAPRAYWLAFTALAGQTIAPRHNHLPVDRGGARVVIEKTASRQEVRTGDLVTYTIRIENQSEQDYLRREDAGGVVIRDILPGGMRLVRGSARAAVDGVPVTLAPIRQPRTLLFRLSDLSLPGRSFELKAGSRIVLRYQTAVGANAREGERLENRAVVMEAGGVALSDVASVSVRMVGDPLFDRSSLRGRVFCDEDGDLWSSDTDPGVYGARVYLDTGRYTVTDKHGRFHFSDVPPGLRMVKIDPDTVPPGSEPVTPISQALHVTRGVPQKTGFGFRCAVTEVGPSEVIPAEKDQPLPPSERVIVTGDLDDLSVSLEGKRAPGKGAPQLLLAGDDGQGGVMDLPWSPRVLPRAVTVRPVLPEGLSVATWRLWIEAEDAQNRWRPVRAMAGQGAPPASLQWDGRSGEGRQMAAVLGALHRIRLELTDGEGSRWQPAPVFFTVGFGRAKAVSERSVEVSFDRRGRLNRSARRVLSGLRRAARQMVTVEAQVVVPKPAEAGQAAREAAWKTAERLRSVVADRVHVSLGSIGLAFGTQKTPLIRLWDAAAIRKVPAPKRRKVVARTALVQGVPVSVDKDGRFIMAPARPADGLVVVELTHKNGARREAVLRVGSQARPPGRMIKAALGQGTLEVAGKAVDLRALTVRVSTEFDQIGLVDGALERPLRFAVLAPSEGIVGWRFAVTGPMGGEVYVAEGEGTPPPSLEWQKGTDKLPPGDYLYGLEVTGEAGLKAWSPSRLIVVLAKPTGGARGRLLRTFRGRLFSGGDLLRKPFRKTLERLAARLLALPEGQTVIVESHGDGAGDDAVAQLSTQTRASRVRSYLVLKGVLETQIEAVGLGNQRALTTRKGAKARRKNGRIEIRAVRGAHQAAVRGWGLRLAGREVFVSKEGTAAARLPRAVSGPSAVEVAGPHGERIVVDLDVPPEPEAAKERPQKAPFGIPTLARALEHQRTQKGPLPRLAVADLSVELPPNQSELGQPVLPIRGTVPQGRGIEVRVNGQPVPVKKGHFELLVNLPNGEQSKVTIEARDKANNVARIEREYRVKGNALFLMVLADGSMSQPGTQLVQQTSDLDLGPVLLHGRAALYLKARIKGGDLIKNVAITAYGDTARRADFSNFVDQIIDPQRTYPVYGDGSTEHTDARTTRRYYVAVEADRSKLIVGSFKPSAWGLELLRYERVMEGVQLRLDQSWKTEGWETVAEAFVDFANSKTRRGQATLLATGGSYYFLPDKELVEGSEEVVLAIYDRDSGVELQRIPQVRDADYRIDYRGGRIVFKKAIASRVDASFLTGAVDAMTGRLGFEGHEVRIQVDYATRAISSLDDMTVGGNAAQTFGGIVTVGGGYVREGRGAGNGRDYQLMGGHVKITPAAKTVVEVEVARSVSGTGGQRLSEDGGLSFRAVGESPQETAEGLGITVRGRTEIGALLGRKDPFLTVEAHWQRQDKGFVSSHSILQQGTERGGASLVWQIAKKQQLSLRHDTLIVDQDDFGVADSLRTMGRYLTSAQYRIGFGRTTVVADLLHSRETDDVRDSSFDREAVAVLVRYRLLPRLSVFGEQQLHLGGDPQVLRETLDGLVTGVGLDLEITRDIALTLGERVRWSGEDAMQLGLRTQLSETTSMYVAQRLFHPRDSSRWVPATVVGSEERFGENGGGRSYGEYQVGSTSTGSFNRAVLGLGRRFEVLPGLNAEFGFERSHTNVVDGLGTARDTNTLSVAGEYLPLDAVKLSTRFEARFESSDHDRMQIVSLNRLTADLGSNVALMAHADIAVTQNRNLDKREAETTNIGFGLAYRPFDETFSVLFKAAHMVEMRPVDLDPALGAHRTTAQVVSLEPIVELPLRFQITPKFAWRRSVEEVEQLDGSILSTESNTILAALRLAFHMWQTLDIAAEYRFINVDLLNQVEQGALAELAINITRYARLGIGYNFTSFSDDLFVLDASSSAEPTDPLSRNDYGFFVRLTGMY